MIQEIDPLLLHRKDPHLIRAQIELYCDDESKSLAIVEGKSDYDFYGLLFHPLKCKRQVIEESENIKSAKLLVCKTIQELRDVKGVIGIIDSDYNFLEEKSFGPNIVLTDYHDIESLILFSETFDKFLSYYGDFKKISVYEKINGKSIREIIGDNSRLISLLLFLSLKNHYGLKFKDMDYSYFIDEKKFLVVEKSLIKTVLENSGKHYHSENKLLNELMQLKESTKEINPYHICRGHDLAEILFLGVKYLFGSDNVYELKDRRDVERNLYKMYEYEFFKTTDMYHLIKDWETNNSPYIILKK